MFTFQNLMGAVRQAIATAETLLPLANFAGISIAAPAIKVVEAAREILTNVQSRVEEGTLVVASTDQAEVKSAADRLSELNDALAAFIENDGPAPTETADVPVPHPTTDHE